MCRARRSALVVGLLALALGVAAQAGIKPEFRLPTLDGKRLGPHDFRGKVVVMDFWATWCGPCQVQQRILDKVHGQFPSAEVQFLAVDVGEDENLVREFVKQRPFPYPVLLDREQRVSGDFGMVGYPTLIVVDRQGELKFAHTGIVAEKEMNEVLQRAGAHASSPPASPPRGGTPAQKMGR